MAHTTLPKEDKAGTSLVEAHMAQVLVAQMESKMPDDAPLNGNSKLLNFVTMVSWIVCRTSLLP
jgi:hypothetical protein